MDREVDLPPPFAPARDLTRPINPDSTSSSSSSFSSSSSSSFSSSSSSPPGLLRHFQAAFKRHRPIGVMQSNSIGPRRILVPQRAVSTKSASSLGHLDDSRKSREVVSVSEDHTVRDSIMQKRTTNIAKDSQEDESSTPSSISGTITKAFDDNLNPYDGQRDQVKSETGCKDNPKSLSHVESQYIDGGQKKVQFSEASKAISQGADHLMATGLENLQSHMSSLALTEMEWVAGNQGEASTVINHEMKHQNTECDITSRSDGGISSLLSKRTTAVQDQLHHFRNFFSQPNSQSSVAGPSCATTTSVHSASAPIANQTTFCSRVHCDSHAALEPMGDLNVNSHPATQGKIMQQSNPCLKDNSRALNDQIAIAAQSSTSAVDTQMESKEYEISKVQQGRVLKESGSAGDSSLLDDRPDEGKQLTAGAIDFQSHITSSKSLSSNVKSEHSKSDKQDRVAGAKGASVHRKRNYDPDLFFKVNGKLYQRLGKIGSGGSSEVHKVISSDCTIYALKKIKLKGRDYATAFGFCQEIEYLNRLKGKHNIIQLIDFEVTDKALLQEVMNGSMNNKDGRVKDDGYIYMVLEYGEIDLAHMLSQKWKELDGFTNQTIDENWLRFYWQQILLAVNTIHEERIVHSDLKPANFLLVKGSLKLIDFGIAKAIMSDTTNIQRDSQVGTLSYMSPEAFMCNESDANGNPIKCGRPSDIWSLGCILYQMVYGRTPFADYKTFWAKFKVITDPNHEIIYEPVSNPWLLDLMKNCLAWDRNERWRIPQLLQHPFLVPPIPPKPYSPQDQCRLLHLISTTCTRDTEASKLCSQLQQLLGDPDWLMTSQLLASPDKRCKLLSQISQLFFQLEKQLSNSLTD
ncbi:serine/threonine-protein kinase MPS1 isoform X2 [Humulus lupulus]|uniref:serine/threonine-protein kinase MPS1 isoform X2 n=1 Tax=Humulus lupulus TaxID=3486 RepID=UPI002B410FEE|nr:serine/threonine-protein kinase MPS1 isoform X2 [Humulus lupulus]